MWLTKPGEIEEVVETSLRAGYRHFDCSPWYNNDREIGNVLQRWFKDGRLKREEVFITSKLRKLEGIHYDIPRLGNQLVQ